MCAAYYNEHDPFAAAWLRQLIAAGHISPGEVDERDVRDVRPADLHGFAQCHFFAGIGVWSYALRRAGWADERPVWTGSCPCQPFSSAGKGGGFDDERHLWPDFHWLISQCRPATVFGEQVASKDGLGWLDLVSADLERTGYAFGAVDTCAAGFGAPHIRQRLYWVADAEHAIRRSIGANREDGRDGEDRRRSEAHSELGARGEIHGLAHHHQGLEGWGQPGRERAAERPAGAGGVAGGLANADGRDASAERQQRGGEQRQQPQDGGTGGVVLADCGGPSAWGEAATSDGHRHSSVPTGGGHPAGPVNGLWRDADWLLCRDGKWRPVEPGTFPLAHGAPARVGRLRGYGNAIVAEQAVAFIQSYIDVRA
jgi:DNA (cytosine-5)-methyltransferase 1